jgi:hypothetical protein
MPALKSSVRALLASLCLTISAAQCCSAQGWTKDPTTWWPDTSTGLMWTGQAHGSPHPDPKLAVQFNSLDLGKNGLSWQEANDYCASLQFGGFADWRLPTLEEVKAATVTRKTVDPYPTSYGTENKAMRELDDAVSQMPYDALFFKRGGIDTFGPMMIWTSTLSQSDPRSAWVVALGAYNPFFTSPMGDPFMGAECVRPMEADLLLTAKAAEVNHPVSDLQTLQTFIPLNKARLAYQAGNYQESISQAQIAVSLKADPATAYWGIGIAYGRLGQWDQAISNLQSALSIDKNYRDAETALKWAKDGLKAAKKEKQPKEPGPKWN